MIDQVKKRVEELFDSGKIDAFLGLKLVSGHVVPYLFDKKEELDNLSIGDHRGAGDARYPLNKILIRLCREYADKRFAVLVRGCDERGLRTLFIWNQLDPQRVIPVGVACPEELAKRCECLKPYPDEFVAGEKTEGVEFSTVRRWESLSISERFNGWMGEFLKCIKCYGCRDICPMCFCKECSLETDELIRRGEFPPEIPIFHLVRASHMAGRCIDCGLCEEACPAGIPLRTLYKRVFEIMRDEFQYETGYTDSKSPLNVGGSIT